MFSVLLCPPPPPPKFCPAPPGGVNLTVFVLDRRMDHQSFRCVAWGGWGVSSHRGTRNKTGQAEGTGAPPGRADGVFSFLPQAAGGEDQREATKSFFDFVRAKRRRDYLLCGAVFSAGKQKNDKKMTKTTKLRMRTAVNAVRGLGLLSEVRK